MRIERAMEILDPNHREHYESIDIVNEACEMGRRALEKQIPKKINITASGAKEIVYGVYVLYKCPECGNKIASGFYYLPYNDILKNHAFCESCGQKIDWSDE